MADDLRIYSINSSDLVYCEHLLIHAKDGLIIDFGSCFVFSDIDALLFEQFEDSSFAAMVLGAEIITCFSCLICLNYFLRFFWSKWPSIRLLKLADHFFVCIIFIFAIVILGFL